MYRVFFQKWPNVGLGNAGLAPDAHLQKIAIAIVETEEKAQSIASEWNQAPKVSSKAKYEAIQ